jgi:hypothetical protein
MLSRQTSRLIPADTSLDAYRFQIGVLRRLGPAGRADLMQQLCRGVRHTLASGIRTRHPDYDERQVKLAMVLLTSGREVFQKIFPEVQIRP